MKKYIVVAVAVLMMFSCGGNKQTDNIQANDTEAVVAPDMHNAENSLDYWGIYEGTLPAADCPGIKTTLTLNKDNTFTLHSEFIDRENAIFDERGSFTLDGNILTLKQDNGTNSYYKVEEGQIRMLDGNKQPINGPIAEHYVLKQTKAF